VRLYLSGGHTMTCDLTADPHALQGAAIRDLGVINVTARQQAMENEKGLKVLQPSFSQTIVRD